MTVGIIRQVPTCRAAEGGAAGGDGRALAYRIHNIVIRGNFDSANLILDVANLDVGDYDASTHTLTNRKCKGGVSRMLKEQKPEAPATWALGEVRLGVDVMTATPPGLIPMG